MSEYQHLISIFPLNLAIIPNPDPVKVPLTVSGVKTFGDGEAMQMAAINSDAYVTCVYSN